MDISFHVNINYGSVSN